LGQADIDAVSAHVRFTPESGHQKATPTSSTNREAGSSEASYEVEKESNPDAHAKKDSNREDGDGGVLRFLKKLIPDVHAV
jgi:hypothetical protein